MKWTLFVPPPITPHSPAASAALLTMRILIGIAFIQHGYEKILAPFSWMGQGSPIPGILQAFAAVAEFGGGFTLTLGLLTPLTSVSMVMTMTGAIAFHLQKGDSFIGGYELASLYLVSTLLLLFIGPGRFAIDTVIQSKSTTSR